MHQLRWVRGFSVGLAAIAAIGVCGTSFGRVIQIDESTDVFTCNTNCDSATLNVAGFGTLTFAPGITGSTYIEQQSVIDPTILRFNWPNSGFPLEQVAIQNSGTQLLVDFNYDSSDASCAAETASFSLNGTTYKGSANGSAGDAFCGSDTTGPSFTVGAGGVLTSALPDGWAASTVTAVPEPGTLGLVIVGALGAYRARRKLRRD